MLTLYSRPTCPHCELVLDTAKELGVELDTRDIAEEKNRQMLVLRGGKQQVPYLVDTTRAVEMYESEDIAKYLREHYGKR